MVVSSFNATRRDPPYHFQQNGWGIKRVSVPVLRELTGPCDNSRRVFHFSSASRDG